MEGISFEAREARQRIWDLEVIGEYVRDEEGLPVIAVFERRPSLIWLILQGGTAEVPRRGMRVIEK